MNVPKFQRYVDAVKAARVAEGSRVFLVILAAVCTQYEGEVLGDELFQKIAKELEQNLIGFDAMLKEIRGE